MKAKLYDDGQLIGHCEADRDSSVLIFGREHYVFNAQLNGYEYAKAQRITRIEYTPTVSKVQTAFDFPANSDYGANKGTY